MAATSRLLLLLIPLLFSSAISPHHVVGAEDQASAIIGFSTQFIHRDSLLSPLYEALQQATSSISSRAASALKRSNARMSYLVQNSGKVLLHPESVESTVFPAGGEYLMRIAVGTPPVKVVAIADTGSDLIWFQCKPCDECYDQNDPLFDPARSSTYRNVSCESDTCGSLRSFCDSDTDTCQYRYSYGDGSVTSGTVATETLTLTGEKFPNTPFGCGHFDNGTFSASDDGLIGLGGGSLSLVRRLGSSIAGKFSYCLVPRALGRKVSSVISFGSEAVVSGGDVITTPRVAADPDTFYYLTLQKITVSGGGDTVRLPDSPGNIIIDSGTTLTYLERSVHDQLISATSAASDLSPVQDPSNFFGLCYRPEGESEFSKLPKLEFGFDNDANLNWLGPMSLYFEVDDGLWCLAVAPTDGTAMIFGNTMQQNVKVGYDLEEGTVSFAPADCAADSAERFSLANLI